MNITEDNFDELISSGKPAMIKFGATWCGPCKALEPTIEELEKEYEGRVVIGSVDVEEEDALAYKFRIRNVPTIIFFKDGQPVDKLIGLMPKNTLKEKLDTLL